MSEMNCINMASNENPFGPSPRAIETMRNAIQSCNFYPDNDARELRGHLAERSNLPPEQVVIGAGSSDLLAIICRALLHQGLNAVTSKLSFIVYAMVTRATGANLVEVPMHNDGFDLEAMLAAISAETRVVFLANPNNPTGTVIPPDEIERFLARVPPHVTVVLDEAYYDFASCFALQRGVQYSRALEYVKEARNVLVLRTFSKAHGLAGVRIGYGFGPVELMGTLGRMRTTFSISGPAQAGALAALADELHVQRAVENNARQAALLKGGLEELGWRVIETWANFLFCELAGDAKAMVKRLQEEGILVRPLGPWGAPNAIRITIGTPEQNRQLLIALQGIVVERSPMRQ
jgi:histidinol-phosphate aminotransferase